MTNNAPFELRFRLGELPEDVEDHIVGQLGGAIALFAGVPYVTLLQDAISGADAAHYALAALRDLGATVTALDPDYVTRSEIAERLGATRQAVAHWVLGKRQADFPFPEPAVQAGATLWCWSDIVEWAISSKHQVDEGARLLTADEIAIVNGQLAAGRMPALV
ncbi:hypothetical protein [Arthrobacter sp. CJ23]|uniref:hypothetical protein n=1 Tax=Arthrobacter sp. CJ23 TaxID=2972479 RepID=UPI00215C5E45|nr:hypothetical protein [Arthrobacter sp. CJ23]UVJ40103.1 hypothetical protein NVV90_02610 [Arthrobacter sp. CJ23]